MQEYDVALPLLDPHGGVEQPRQFCRQRGELVIVRGEQRPAAVALMQMLDRRPGDRQPVEGRGAPADFVKNHQRAFAGLIENHRGLDHLHHEGGAAARQIVGSAHAREQPIDNADPRPRGRHKAADLRQQRDQRILAQEGRFARHVRAGDQPDLARPQTTRLRGRQIAGVGNERLAVALQRLFDHRMAAAFDGETQ